MQINMARLASGLGSRLTFERAGVVPTFSFFYFGLLHLHIRCTWISPPTPTSLGAVIELNSELDIGRSS